MAPNMVTLRINEACEIAQKYGQTQQIRERMTKLLGPLLRDADPAPPESVPPYEAKIVPVRPSLRMLLAGAEALNTEALRQFALSDEGSEAKSDLQALAEACWLAMVARAQEKPQKLG